MTATDPAGDHSITLLFQRMQQGDKSAVKSLWSRYVPRLLGLARSSLGGWDRGPMAAEDVVQSAFFSFWKTTQQPDADYNLKRDDIWNLLGLMTVRKVRDQLRREMAAKRGGGRVVSESAVPHDEGSDFRLDQIAAIECSDFDQCCEELLLLLSDDLRRIALLRMMAHSNAEISELLNCSERTVERKVGVIRTIWHSHLPPVNVDVAP